MKSLFFILICSYLLTIIGCNNETPSPTQNPIEENSTLVLKFSEGTAPISDAKVVIGNDTLYTGETGTINFPNLQKGTYHIVISHNEFAPIDTTIIFTGDIVRLSSTRLYYDYFPLKLGNKWIYDYSFHTFTYDYICNTMDSSTIIWEIVEEEHYANYNLFRIKEVNKWRINDDGNISDTSFITGFLIKEYDIDSLVFEVDRDPAYSERNWLTYPLDRFYENDRKIKRYFPVGTQQYIYDKYEYINAGFYISLAKNAGLLNITRPVNTGSVHSQIQFEYNLKEFIKK